MNFINMNSFRNILIVLAAIILLTSSCKNIFRKDLSFTEKEYESRGMPDIRKNWSESELIKAHVTLGNIRTKNFFTLPVKGSPKSGNVFKKIVSRENLSFLDDPAKSLRDKAYEIQTIANFQNEISSMYTDNLRIEQYYSTELIDIYISEIYIRGKMLELAEKIMNSKDPGDIAMSSARQAIVGGYVNLLSTLIREQKKTRSFTSADLKKLSRETAKSIHDNIKYLDSESKQKLSGEIRGNSDNIKAGSVRKDFDEMLKFLLE